MRHIENEVHSKLAGLIDFAPTLKKLYANDVAIIISDREKAIFELTSKELNVDNVLGFDLPKDSPIYIAMLENKLIAVEVPKQVYGVPFRVMVAPIKDEHGEVIGSIAISSSLNNQTNLIQVAEQFTTSSDEISASTEKLSSSADKLMKYMIELTNAQKEMNEQVESTSKILELINTVAKNTRILGFNAGIEAARSGEHGRGFSVVAKEITKLADQSAGSVDEIRKLLNLVKEKVELVASTVNQTVGISEHQSTSIEEISQAIQQLTAIGEDVENLAKKI